MKASPDFILRHIVDEYILMPTGKNISTYNGTVLLNAVSAFVFEKLQNEISYEDLLAAVLNEFEVAEETARKDLDELLDTFRKYQLLIE